MGNTQSVEKRYGTQEAPVKEDSLKLDVYTTGISEFIKKCPTPMTISLQGDWGSGKTSLFNLIEKKLNNNQDMDWSKESFEAKEVLEYPVITINTWQFAAAGYQDSLAAVLLALLSSRFQKFSKIIESKDKALKSIFTDLEKKVCSFLRLGASALGFYIGGEAGAEAVASFVNDKKDAAIPNRKHITAECVMEIEEMKAAMQKAIRSICEGERTNAKKIIIFVDDLDRLEPKNAVELLEGIKNFVDCENCVFVLALDQKVVFEGVKEKYGEELGAVMAKKFFDKIIQVPFTLPVVSYDVKDFIKEQRMDASENLIEYYNKIVSKLTDKNPRTIKRLLNMSFLYEQFEIEKEIVDDVYRAILLAFLAVQLKAENALKKLVKAVADLQKNKIIGCVEIQKIKAEIEKIIEEGRKAKEDFKELKKDGEAMENFEEVIEEILKSSKRNEKEIYTIIFKVLKGALGASCSIEDAIRPSLKPQVDAFDISLLENAEADFTRSVLEGGSVYEYRRGDSVPIKLCILGTSFSVEVIGKENLEKVKNNLEKKSIQLKLYSEKADDEQAENFYYEETETGFEILRINNHYSKEKIKELGSALKNM